MRTVALILILVVVVIILLILRAKRKQKREIMPVQEKAVQESASPEKPQGEVQGGEKENKI